MTHHDESSAASKFWRRAYRALMRLLPQRLRARQGDAMLELFGRELQRSEPNGALAVWRTGATGIVDLAGRALYERVIEERRELTRANLGMLRQAAFAFLTTTAVLTTLLVARAALMRASPLADGTLFDVILFSIPYTAALTIPMSVFIAVLWAASRRPAAARRDDESAEIGALRLAPVIGMASAVALCCLALNAELVPRANLRLQAMYAGRADVVPSDRSITLRELREAEARLVSGPRAVSTSSSDGASLASYEVEIEKKFALAAACVALALLAAGISRRASSFSIGSQFVISLMVFAGYYVCIITAEQLADRGEIPPTLAMWSADIIVLVLAMLTLRAPRGARALTAQRPFPAT